jgi:uncharacterized membrane protein YgdD (TMEM256/DUF423 family)
LTRTKQPIHRPAGVRCSATRSNKFGAGPVLIATAATKQQAITPILKLATLDAFGARLANSELHAHDHNCWLTVNRLCILRCLGVIVLGVLQARDIIICGISSSNHATIE